MPSRYARSARHAHGVPAHFGARAPSIVKSRFQLTVFAGGSVEIFVSDRLNDVVRHLARLVAAVPDHFPGHVHVGAGWTTPRAIQHLIRFRNESADRYELRDSIEFADGGRSLVVTQVVPWEVRNPGPRSSWHAVRVFEVSGPNGALLNIQPLLEIGIALNAEDRAQQRNRWYRGLNYCGYGPVPRVRKFRGGNGHYRKMSTTPERRLNALVLDEEGEVACRAARQGHNLPSSWDDFGRHKERIWKSQHRGRKSWDRVCHGTKAIPGSETAR